MTKKRTEWREGPPGHAVHDVGGVPLAPDIGGPIDRAEHDLELWAKRTDAMIRLMSSPKKKAFTVDAMRRVIESYNQQQYDATTYYEKWIRALRNLCLEQGVFSDEELAQKVKEAREAFRAEGREVTDDEVPYDVPGAPIARAT